MKAVTEIYFKTYNLTKEETDFIDTIVGILNKHKDSIKEFKGNWWKP